MREATTATNVLHLVSTAVRAVPGVTRLGRSKGVVVQPAEDGLVVECYVHAAAGIYLPDLGVAIQATVAAVLRDIAGLTAGNVNIYIVDVEASRG